MENGTFFNMEYTLGDILMIIGYVGGLILLFIVVRERLTRLEVQQDTINEKLTALRSDVDQNRAALEKERRYLVEKLAQIETGQARTNVFLEENLKNLTRIIAMHETEIDKIKDKLDKINTNTSVK